MIGSSLLRSPSSQLGDWLPCDAAFEVFMATVCRADLCPWERRFFDYHVGRAWTSFETARAVVDYKHGRTA